MSESWEASGFGSVEFKYNIENWLSDPDNVADFKSAIEGNERALDWLPHWVSKGARKMLREMKRGNL